MHEQNNNDKKIMTGMAAVLLTLVPIFRLRFGATRLRFGPRLKAFL